MALTGDGALDGAELLTCSGLDALQVMEEDVKGSRAEEGCQRFDLLDLGAGKFSFYEVYKDADAMAYHKTLPHYKGCAQLIAQLGSGVAGPVSPNLLHAPARGGLQGCQHGHRGGLADSGQICDCRALPVMKNVGEQRAADRGRTVTLCGLPPKPIKCGPLGRRVSAAPRWERQAKQPKAAAARPLAVIKDLITPPLVRER